MAFRNEMKIIDIALSAGFDSREAYSRAFKKHFCLSPSNFRKSPDWSLWHVKYDPILLLRQKVSVWILCQKWKSPLLKRP
nr:helix-turn-helix domain-containing protein [Pseudoalteromonas luteoviolacea]